MIDQHVRARRGKALILCHEIARIVERDLLSVRDGIHRVADVLVISFGLRERWRLCSRELATALKIKQRVGGSGRRPISNPLIRAGVKQIEFLDLRDVAFVLQKIIEERQLEMLAKINSRLAPKVSRAQPVSVGSRPTAVKPRTHYQHVVGSGILLLDALIGAECAE